MASGKTFSINAGQNADIADLGGNTVSIVGSGTVAFEPLNNKALFLQNGTLNVNNGSTT